MIARARLGCAASRLAITAAPPSRACSTGSSRSSSSTPGSRSACRSTCSSARAASCRSRSFLARARHELSFADFPTLFWLGVTDSTLTLGIVVGVILSLVALAGRGPRVVAAVQVALYLSYATAARTFLSFQWDNLLLECGFFAIFLPRDRRSPWMHTLFRLILLKLYWESGIAKWQSHLHDWQDGSAMTYYYETAPLPTALAWYCTTRRCGGTTSSRGRRSPSSSACRSASSSAAAACASPARRSSRASRSSTPPPPTTASSATSPPRCTSFCSTTPTSSASPRSCARACAWARPRRGRAPPTSPSSAWLAARRASRRLRHDLGDRRARQLRRLAARCSPRSCRSATSTRRSGSSTRTTCSATSRARASSPTSRPPTTARPGSRTTSATSRAIRSGAPIGSRRTSRASTSSSGSTASATSSGAPEYVPTLLERLCRDPAAVQPLFRAPLPPHPEAARIVYLAVPLHHRRRAARDRRVVEARAGRRHRRRPLRHPHFPEPDHRRRRVTPPHERFAAARPYLAAMKRILVLLCSLVLPACGSDNTSGIDDFIAEHRHAAVQLGVPLLHRRRDQGARRPQVHVAGRLRCRTASSRCRTSSTATCSPRGRAACGSITISRKRASRR